LQERWEEGGGGGVKGRGQKKNGRKERVKGGQLTPFPTNPRVTPNSGERKRNRSKKGTGHPTKERATEKSKSELETNSL